MHFVSACNAGFHGAGCLVPCGNCIQGTTCHHLTAECSGDCEPGWQGTKCDAGKSQYIRYWYGFFLASICFFIIILIPHWASTDHGRRHIISFNRMYLVLAHVNESHDMSLSRSVFNLFSFQNDILCICAFQAMSLEVYSVLLILQVSWERCHIVDDHLLDVLILWCSCCYCSDSLEYICTCLLLNECFSKDTTYIEGCYFFIAAVKQWLIHQLSFFGNVEVMQILFCMCV